MNTSHRSIILEIKQTMDILKTQNIKIELNWTPGHAEIAGNKIDDKLAKEASVGKMCNPHPRWDFMHRLNIYIAAKQMR